MSLDFYILILYVKSIILYSFVERDKTLAVHGSRFRRRPIFADFSIRAENWKKKNSVYPGNITEMFLDTRPQQVFRAFKGF